MRTTLKKRHRCFWVLLSLFIVGMGWSDPGGAVQKVDHGIYAGLLARYVQNGVVDYAGFKAAEDQLDQYLNVLSAVDPDVLDRAERFAFYVNVYNAWTIKLILNHYPGIQSIKDAGSLFQSPWKKKLVRIHGSVLTLDDVEHNILRPRFRDPRVHFAVNCASKGCPPLMAEPFYGDRLEQQLDAAAESFVNDSDYTRLDGETLHISKIFQWFSEDFGHDPLDFIGRYARGELRQRLAALKDRVRIQYLDYDWSLNGR